MRVWAKKADADEGGSIVVVCSEVQLVADRLDRAIIRWALRQHKRLRGFKMRAISWFVDTKRKQPNIFAHWYERGAFSVGAMGAR